MEKSRIEAFSDGIFAVAATLLVTNLHLPGSSAVAQGIVRVLPNQLVYVLSFMIVAVYWVAHHMMFHYVARVDRGLLWLNNLTLLCVAAVPFPAAVLGSHPLDPAAIILYAASLSLINLTGTIAWRYAASQPELTKSRISPLMLTRVSRLHLAPVLAYSIAAGLGFWQPLASLFIFAAVPLFFILPNPLLRKALGES